MAHYDKQMERKDLNYFLRARESATGEKLTFQRDSESPDFICTKPSGDVVGIEHMKIEHNPEHKEFLEDCRRWDCEIDNFAVFWAAGLALIKKEEKRTKPHWNVPDATILVLDLKLHCRIEEWPEDSSYAEEFDESGFIEVWISDHSSIETHGEVTAIGLYPKSIWGIRGQDYLWAPPD